MMRKYTSFTVLAALTLLCSNCLVRAGSPPNPFSEIANRNAFALNLLPSNPPIIDLPHAPAARLTLTGITTILGNKLALLKVHFPAAAGEPARDLYLSLTEGESQDGFKMVEIDEVNATVKVDCFGSICTFSLRSIPSRLMFLPPKH